MREQLESWEIETLFNEMRRDAQRSGYTARDAVRLVREYRREKKAKQAMMSNQVVES
jgi:hypothetical protein